MINVTKSFLPPLEQYNAYIQGVFERGHLTNHGPLVLELEDKLRKYLGVPHLWFLNNGTIAIQIAIKALELKGEVITTPFSYVATTSSLVWEQCTPVFADIDPHTLTISPEAIREKITPQTTAILATHVYGIPCDVEAIAAIAKEHNLKVIYDAAHAFGVNYKGQSILNYGDISTLSFHATKLFHTVEGGAVVCTDPELNFKMSYLRNFGHNGPEAFHGVGVNGKSSEFHAAMGLCVLPYMQHILESRKQACAFYDEQIAGLPLQRPMIPAEVDYNYAYYPVLFPSEAALLKVKAAMNAAEIFPRRYFYPALNTLPYLSSAPMKVAEDVASRVLCLPLYADMRQEDLELVAQYLRNNL